MTVQISIQSRGAATVMQVAGVLNSATQAQFKQKAEEVLGQPGVSQLTFDFSRLQSIEPSSSGMIMFLNHTAKSKNKTLSITNPTPAVLQFLQKANIGKIVPIQ